MARKERTSASNEQHPAEDESQPIGPDKERLAEELGLVVLRALAEAPAPPRLIPAGSGEPTTPEEFGTALGQLHELGWTFDESYPARVQRVASAPPTSEELAELDEIQERHPYLPLEVAEITWSMLTGNDPDATLVGNAAGLAAKRDAAQHFVLTAAARERFYLRHCSKVSRFSGMDWEVVIKAAERGHKASPSFVYALATLDAVMDVHGHHEHEKLSFAIGPQGLGRLIEELSELKRHLERVSTEVAASTHNQGDQHARD